MSRQTGGRRQIKGSLIWRRPAAALLFSCNGRGTRLFPQPDHDTAAVRAEAAMLRRKNDPGQAEGSHRPEEAAVKPRVALAGLVARLETLAREAPGEVAKLDLLPRRYHDGTTCDEQGHASLAVTSSLNGTGSDGNRSGPL